MKMFLMLAAVIVVFGQNAIACEQPDGSSTPLILDRAQIYTNGNSFDGDINGNKVIFYGAVDTKGTGLVLEPKQGIPLGDSKSIVLQVQDYDHRSDRFYLDRLLKLEIDGRPLKTRNIEDRNKYDTTYVNARNGDFYFDLESSIIKSGRILKFLISFYGGENGDKTTMKKLKVCSWLTK